MKRFLKLFLASGITFGLLFGSLMYSSYLGNRSDPLNIRILAPILSGLCFGFFVAVSFLFLEKYMVKKNGGKAHAAELRQEKNFSLPISKEDALNRAQEVMLLLKAKIKSIDKNKGLIVAKRGISWKSFGEKLIISLKEDKEYLTVIKVESEPALRLAMVDYGKNLENVEKFFSLMKVIGKREGLRGE